MGKAKMATPPDSEDDMEQVDTELAAAAAKVMPTPKQAKQLLAIIAAITAEGQAADASTPISLQKFLINLFAPARGSPPNEKAVLLKGLLQQPHLQLLSPAPQRKRQRHCQLPHKLHQKISCAMPPRNVENIPLCAAIPTTREYSVLFSSFFSLKKKNFLVHLCGRFLKSPISLSSVSLFCVLVRTHHFSSLEGLCFRMHMFMFVCMCSCLCSVKLFI